MAKSKFEHDRYYRSQEQKKSHKKQVPTDEEPELPPPVEPVKGGEKVGRNEPCPCGSGKKYKQCCGRA